MELLCVICQESIRLMPNELGDSAQRISALVCGHVFHMFCIDKWLEQNQKKSCPKCRYVVNQRQGKTAFQLFLELERPESNSEDLPEDSATRARRKKELDMALNNLKRCREKCAYLKNEHDSLKIEHTTLNTRLETTERLFSITKARHRTDLQELNQSRTELIKLQNLVQSLRSTNTFINGSVTDAEEVVANDLLDKSQLAVLCVTYKKDGQKLMKKLEEASDALGKCERENHVLQSDLKRFMLELEELKSVHRMMKPNNAFSNPDGNEENAVPPIRLAPTDVNRVEQVKRPKLVVGSLNRKRLSCAVRNPPEEKYDGLGGHTNSSLFPKKCKIVTTRTVFKK